MLFLAMLFLAMLFLAMLFPRRALTTLPSMHSMLCAIAEEITKDARSRSTSHDLGRRAEVAPPPAMVAAVVRVVAADMVVATAGVATAGVATATAAAAAATATAAAAATAIRLTCDTLSLRLEVHRGGARRQLERHTR